MEMESVTLLETVTTMASRIARIRIGQGHRMAQVTKTEMDTAHGLLATEAKQDIIDTVVDGIQTDLDNATDGLGALKTLIDDVESKVDDLEGRLTAARAGYPAGSCESAAAATGRGT